MEGTEKLYEKLQAAQTEYYNAYQQLKKAEENLLAICDEMRKHGEKPSGW